MTTTINSKHQNIIDDVLICLYVACLRNHRHRVNFCPTPDFPDRILNRQQIVAKERSLEYWEQVSNNRCERKDDWNRLKSFALSGNNASVSLQSTSEFCQTIKTQFHNATKPNYILKFDYENDENENEENDKDKKTIVGFHGSALGNFYSIIYNGFDIDERCSNESLFGKGVYFATVKKKKKVF
jgi:hypothetical protein